MLRRNTVCASVASYGYVPSSLILATLMMEALSFSETSVLTRATWHKNPDDAILQNRNDLEGNHYGLIWLEGLRKTFNMLARIANP
jgi:hypothetical protein